MTEAEFARVRKLRMALRDPAGANDLIFAGSLPEKPDANAAYYIAGLGGWQKFNEKKNAWERPPLKLSDAYIIETVNEKGAERGAVALIDFIIMGLQAGVISFGAGAEKVTRASLQEEIELYREQKRILTAQAGMNSGRTMRTGRPLIGGVQEA